MTINIGREEIKINELIDVDSDFYGNNSALIETEEGEFYLFEDSESAGESAHEYWLELAKHDPEEFSCLVGQKNLTRWALNELEEYGGDIELVGPGSKKVASLGGWLDLWLDTPAEQWASYDGESIDVLECSRDLIEEIGFTPTVAYRHN